MKLGILPACSHWVYVHGGGARPNSEEKSGVFPPKTSPPESFNPCKVFRDAQGREKQWDCL